MAVAALCFAWLANKPDGRRLLRERQRLTSQEQRGKEDQRMSGLHEATDKMQEAVVSEW